MKYKEIINYLIKSKIINKLAFVRILKSEDNL